MRSRKDSLLHADKSDKGGSAAIRWEHGHDVFRKATSVLSALQSTDHRFACWLQQKEYLYTNAGLGPRKPPRRRKLRAGTAKRGNRRAEGRLRGRKRRREEQKGFAKMVEEDGIYQRAHVSRGSACFTEHQATSAIFWLEWCVSFARLPRAHVMLRGSVHDELK